MEKTYHNIAEELLCVARLIKADKKSYGRPLSSKIVSFFGEIIPYYVGGDRSLREFWNDNNADWSDNVKAFVKDGKITLVSNSANQGEIDLELKAPEYRWKHIE